MAEENSFYPAEVEKLEHKVFDVEPSSTPMIKGELEFTDMIEKTGIQGDNEEEELVINQEKKANSTEPDEAAKQQHILNKSSEEEKPTEKDKLEVGGMRRRSLIMAATLMDNVPSRYLRPSGGTCHDICKFGHRNALEEKAKHTPFFRVRSEFGDVPIIGFGAQNNTRSVVRRLSFPENKAEKKCDLGNKEMEVSRMSSSVAKLRKSETPIKTSKNCIDVKTVKRYPVNGQKSLESSIRKVREIKTGKGEEKSAAQASGSISSELRLKDSRRFAAKLYRDPRSSNVSKSQRNFQAVKKPEVVTQRSVHKTEPYGKDAVGAASPSQLQKLQKAQRTGRNEGQTTSKTKRLMKKEVSQPWRKELSKSENAHAKKIERISGDVKSKGTFPKAKPTMESKEMVKRVGTNPMGENLGSIWKMKFRRGTIVALPIASSAPRKLRFKRAVSLTEFCAVESVANTSIKNIDVNGDGSVQSESKSVKVVLRHQKGPEKKDNVDLNNVIEETVGELVKTRKSKVKALVGAFETVMSLGDRKTLITSGAS